MENLVGYRFVPTDQELINHYLKNKNLGKSWLVDEAINEVDICRYDPPDLLRLSKIEMKDPVWYFFSRKEYTSVKKKWRKRTTPSGFWKPTGVDRKIKDKRGNRGEIGIKRSLTFYLGKVSDEFRTDWAIHEYDITCLREDQRTYVICQVMYKGEDEIPSGNISSEPSHSLVSNLNTVNRISTPSEAEQPGQEIFNGLGLEDLENPIYGRVSRSLWEELYPNMLDDNHPHGQQFPDLIQDDELYPNESLSVDDYSISSMHVRRNDCMPKRSLSGIIANYNSDSDAESISAMSYQGTSSPSDSVGSSDKAFPDCGGEICVEPSLSKKSLESQSLQANANSKAQGKFTELQRSRPLKQKAMKQAFDPSVDKQLAMVKTEKKEWFITEEAMDRKRRNPPYIYLMNVIISFILLVGLIGDIISVLLSANS